MEDFNKKCIITPTFSGHFCFIKKYLKSFDMYVEDKDDCVIYFVISKSEDTEFKKIISAYKNSLDIRVLFLEDILEHFSIPETPAMILSKYKKFSFQAIKKFYTMLYLENYKHFLVMDSETMWINKTNMKQMFDNFFSNPYIACSEIEKRPLFSKSNHHIVENINFLLNQNDNLWFIEQFMRFWDVKILKNLIKEYGTPYEMVLKLYDREMNLPFHIGLFESCVYDQYIYHKLNKYGYKLLNFDKELENTIGESEIKKFKEKVENTYHGSCGMYEFFANFARGEMLKGLLHIYKKYNISIVRIEHSNKNYIEQKYFLKQLKPNILTCSQNHAFGLNSNLLTPILVGCKISINYKGVEKHLKRITHPFKILITWISEFISIIYYIFKLILDLIINLFKLILVEVSK